MQKCSNKEEKNEHNAMVRMTNILSSKDKEIKKLKDELKFCKQELKIYVKRVGTINKNTTFIQAHKNHFFNKHGRRLTTNQVKRRFK